MGQTAVELPDSPGNAAAPMTSADDLLSQLAGQEIDRMLAESGDTKISAAETETDAPAPVDAPPAADDPMAAQFDELFKQLQESPLDEKQGAKTAVAPAPVAKIPSGPAAERAALQEATPEPQAPSESVAAESRSAESTVAEIPVPEKPAPAAEVAKTPVEPEPAPAIAATAPAEVIAPAVTQSTPSEEASVSILVRILEIINAPLASCPDAVRDALGKVAILTMMNAVGVLFYLMIFKK
ncbi:MAG TPA: hypothetical protein VHD56_14320 [Tepidisphaeraceae bacterium]|nr:hypothetical protein [Tepidisphaeraceae bacterium]